MGLSRDVTELRCMREVHRNLYVGDGADCTGVAKDWSVVHACKYPCHNRMCGNPPQGHDDYLTRIDGDHLYLNMVDMDQKQKHEFMEPMLSASLDFIQSSIDSNSVLIHCNQGVSRSPTIGMIYLAKRAGEISNKGYRPATEEFSEKYPQYNPGRGIHLYLEDYWDAIE